MKITDAAPLATEYLGAVQRVVDALTIKGPAPDVHDQTYARLRASWPTLGAALDNLVTVHRKVAS